MNKSYTVVWNESKGCWSVAGESAKQRGKSSCSGVRAGVMAAVVMGLSALMPVAHALPTGATVTHGTAQVGTYGKEMVITQSTPKAVIDWNAFGIEAGERVTFSQRTSDMTLNYVSGNATSNINGTLNAQGKIFIVNPNGIVFNSGASVNVGSLVASTLVTDPTSFYNNTNGEFVFEAAGTNVVRNNGGVITANSGDVLLLGAHVTNMGTIQSHRGTTALAAGEKITVSMGSGLVKVEINAAAANALARNSGTIRADGGQVLLKASAPSASPLSTVVNNTGVIEAKTLNNVPGKIVLHGGTQGTVEVAGRLSATGLTSYGNGGAIEASGKNVRVRLGTTIDTRATNGSTGAFKLTSDGINVESTATSTNPTIHADTLNRNLATTNVELASAAGDIEVNAPLNWTSGNSLTLNAQHGGAGKTVLNETLSASGANSALSLLADERIDISDRILLDGPNARIALTTTAAAPGTGGASGKPATANYVLRGPDANITLSGAGASFLSNNIYHTVIQDQAALQAINNNLNGLYVLGTDLQGTEVFQPIGGAYGAFNGVFDGMGHTLTDFSVATTGDNLGLFSSSAGIIRNLNLASMYVTSTNANVASMSIGALAGRNTGMIDNVKVTNTTVNGDAYRANVVGGLVGTNQKGTISNSAFSGSVFSNTYTSSVGGLVGVNRSSGKILSSQASGFVSGVLQHNGLGGIGGLVGFNDASRIQDSTSAVEVNARSANLNVGGLVGSNRTGTLTNVSSTGTVSGDASSNVGGLVGVNIGNITLADSSGQVFAASGSSAGGLVGAHNGGTISTATASGKVSTSDAANTGGLVGANNANLEDVRASNIVDDWQYAGNIGGLVGYNGVNGSIQNGESSGESVSSYYGYTNAGTRMGGLVGANDGDILFGISNVEKVIGGNYAAVGGLVGYNSGTIIASNAASLTQGGEYSTTGGLAGMNTGQIIAGTASGMVIGNHYATIGGLVGQNHEDGLIEHSTAEGRVTGQQDGSYYYSGTGMALGGLVGINQGEVNDSTASGQVDFRHNMSQAFGGLTAINYGTMQGNSVWGQAAQVPIVGTNYGWINMFH